MSTILPIAAAIELVGALIIVGFAVAALYRLAAGVEAARLTMAEGVVAGLSVKTAATLLRALTLHSWTAIGMFAGILVLRLVVKRLLQWERERINRSLIRGG